MRLRVSYVEDCDFLGICHLTVEDGMLLNGVSNGFFGLYASAWVSGSTQAITRT